MDISYGAINSPKDYRDIPLSAVPTTGALPAEYFVPVANLPVEYQGKIGACVGHAAQKYKQRLDYVDENKVYELSPRFLYAVAKCQDGYQDEGTYPRLVAKILKDTGCALKETIPNDVSLSHEEYVYNRDITKIPSKAFEEAGNFKIKSYAFPNVKNSDELKRAIIEGNGAMMLMRLGDEWWKDKNGNASWNANDIIPLRPPKQVVSGHEVYLYGYSTESGRLKFYIFNSWSAGWGEQGKAWFYYDEMVDYLVEAITFVDVPHETIQDVENLPDASSFHHVFKTQVRYGQKSDEVKALQTALMIDGIFDRDTYAELLKTGQLGYYGNLTRLAVKSYQYKYNLASSAEILLINGLYVGPKTRAHLTYQFGS